MGGRELKYSLLTAYFMVTDASFNLLGDLYLHVKPDDGDYIVSGQGMSVNKIDLAQHDKIALPYKQAKPMLYDFLKKYGASNRVTPVGHGVRGDIDFVLKYLTSQGSWEQFVTYHYIDTSVFLQILRAMGKIPEDTDGSVQALADYFGVKGPTVAQWHDAKFDTQMGMRVYQKMLELANHEVSCSHVLRLFQAMHRQEV